MNSPTAQDVPPRTFADKVKDASLRASGIGFIIGDAAFFAADRMNKDNTGSLTGLTYLAGAAVAARYGKESPEHRLVEMQRKLRRYLMQEGVAIPQGTALTRDAITQPQGLLDQVESFFYRYPSQILNGMFAFGGTFKIASGLKQHNSKAVAYGSLVTLAGLTGLLVPEKAPDPDHPPQHLAAKLWEKVQAKPLQAASTIYLFNNINIVRDAFSQRAQHRRDGSKPGYQLTFLTAAAYIVSNGLLGLASKDQAKQTARDGRAMEALESAAAEVLAAQSPELREALVERVAGYLSAQPEVHVNAETLAKEIHEKIALHLEKPQRNWESHVALQDKFSIER